MRTQARPYHSEYSDGLRTEGLQKGIEEGALMQTRSILVRMIEATQTGITDAQRRRIEASTDRQELEAWITKFIASGSAAGLFEA